MAVFHLRTAAFISFTQTHSISFSKKMGTNSTEILHDFSPMMRVYKDGRLERLSGVDFVPPGVDPDTGVNSKDVKISSDPNVSARLYLPKNAKPGHKLPLLVYFHGGGFVVESAFSPIYNRYMNSLTAEANVIIVSVDYRLAPEHPLPAAYDDCWLALKWVASHSKDGSPDSWLQDYADFDKVYFGGDSAGGNLAHQMALKVGIEKLEGLNLIGIFLNCPYFWGKDPIGQEASRVEWKKFIDALWLFTYPNSGVDDPLINPAMDPNLSSLGCKRVLIFVAEKDILRDRGLHYKETLKNTTWSGEIPVVEFEGEDHVFNLFFPNGQNAVSMNKTLVSFINQEKVTSYRTLRLPFDSDDNPWSSKCSLDV